MGRQRSAEQMASAEYDIKCALKAHSANLFWLCDHPRKLKPSTDVDLGKHYAVLALALLTLQVPLVTHYAQYQRFQKVLLAQCALSGSAVKEQHEFCP